MAQPEETLRIWERRVAVAGEGEEGGEGEGDAAVGAPVPGGFVCVCVCDAPHGRDLVSNQTASWTPTRPSHPIKLQAGHPPKPSHPRALQ